VAALASPDRYHVRGHGELAWSLTIAAAVVLIARGVFLGRPVTAKHATGAALILMTGWPCNWRPVMRPRS
jgi:uncharacterized membrane protein